MCKEVRSTVQFSSVAQLCLTLRPHELQHTRPPCPPPSPGVYSNSCPLSWWCHPTISPSVVPFSYCLQSFPESGSFPVSRFLTSGGHIIGVSASASVLPMNIQDWFPLGWMGWISLQSKGLSRVFSNTTVQKHPFFSAQGMAHDGSWGEDGKKWHGDMVRSGLIMDICWSQLEISISNYRTNIWYAFVERELLRSLIQYEN